MLEIHCILVDHPLGDVEQARGLDAVQSFSLVRAEVEGNLGLCHLDHSKEERQGDAQQALHGAADVF